MGEAPRLKPRIFSEIVDASFRLYRENFVSFVGILAVVYVPATLLQLVLTALLMGPLIEMQGKEDQIQNPEQVFQVILVPALAMLGFALLFNAIAIPIANGALTRAVGARYLNEEISFGKCYGHILRMVFRYLGTVILSGLVISLGAMACCVPFFFLTVFFAFTAQVCVLEGLGGTTAMGRSMQLTTGHRWRVFGMWAFGLLLPVAVGIVLGPALGVGVPLLTDNLMTQQLVTQAVQQVAGLLIQPFFSVTWILLYYDLRIRKEAFDLEVLAKTMGSPGGFFPDKPAPSA
jgi:hypothetical protein